MAPSQSSEAMRKTNRSRASLLLRIALVDTFEDWRMSPDSSMSAGSSLYSRKCRVSVSFFMMGRIECLENSKLISQWRKVTAYRLYIICIQTWPSLKLFRHHGAGVHKHVSESSEAILGRTG